MSLSRVEWSYNIQRWQSKSSGRYFISGICDWTLYKKNVRIAIERTALSKWIPSGSQKGRKSESASL